VSGSALRTMLHFECESSGEFRPGEKEHQLIIVFVRTLGRLAYLRGCVIVLIQACTNDIQLFNTSSPATDGDGVCAPWVC
jgi:hypothetical protein